MNQGIPADFALAYAAMGLSILPLAVGENVPHQMLGAGWSFSADDDRGRAYVGSGDTGQIHDWWSDEPLANIGIVTGRPSRLLVVDMDVSTRRSPYPGARWVTAWESDTGRQLPNGPLAQTPSGGWHLWMRYRGETYMPTRVNWLPNVDVKADGGFVAAPPSMRVRHGPIPGDGGAHRFGVEYVEYRWVRPLPDSLDLVPDAPEWLLADVIDRPRRIHQSARASSTDGIGRLTADSLIRQGGFGNRTGSRDCDCIAFARVMFNDYDGDELAVTEDVRRVWQVTSDLRTFPWSQAEKCIRSARHYWEGARA